MPGLIGGAVGGGTLREMAGATYQRERHAVDLVPEAGLGVVHHGEADPAGAGVVEAEGAVGVVYGVAPRQADWVRPVLEDPVGVLPDLDGPFLLACVDRETGRVVLATDKTGTRPAYYAEEDGFAFGSELKAVVPLLESPTLDERAVADVVLMAHAWGPKTLLEEVRALPPASVAVYEDGELSVEQYWTYDFDFDPRPGYVETVATALSNVVGDLDASVHGRLGVWLSGGLDSRILSAALKGHRPEFQTFTYNRPLERSNPLFAGDVDIARTVAETLEVDHQSVELTADKVCDHVGEAVEITDGMVGWHTLTNLCAVFDLDPESVDVLIEGSASSLLCGEHVPVSALVGDRPPAEELYAIHRRTDDDTLRSVLAADVDPRDTFLEEAARSEQPTRAETVLAVTNHNYYNKKHYMSNKLSRAFFGTREPFASGELLDAIADMPLRLRRHNVPFSDTIPIVPSRMKLGLVREFDKGLDKIPYEATQLKPIRPYWAHGAGFVVKSGLNRLLYGRTLGEWYESEDRFRAFLDRSLERAADLPVFDRAGIERLREEQLRGDADHMETLASISTVDLFVETVLGEVPSVSEGITRRP